MYFKNNLFPFSFGEADCKFWKIEVVKKLPSRHDDRDIMELEQSGLLHEKESSLSIKRGGERTLSISFSNIDSYNLFRTLNNHQYLTCISNRTADFEIEYSQFQSLFGPVSDHKVKHILATNKIENSVIICDSKNNKMVVQTFQFDDYIRASFCVGNFLVVELIDETLQKSDRYPQPIHKKGAPSPCNHRIEIYNLKTKKKLYGIGLPLIKPYQFNIFSYSLFYVDSDNIYLYNHENNMYISLPYKNSSVNELNGSDDFFITQSTQKVPEHGLKYIASDDDKPLEKSSEKTLLNLVPYYQALKEKNLKDSTQFIMIVMFLVLLTHYYTFFATAEQ